MVVWGSLTNRAILSSSDVRNFHGTSPVKDLLNSPCGAAWKEEGEGTWLFPLKELRGASGVFSNYDDIRLFKFVVWPL